MAKNPGFLRANTRLGSVIELPWRPQRYFCLPILWRVYEKQGQKSKTDHRTKSQLAAEMVVLLAGWFPQRSFLVVADSASIGKHLLRQRPANVEALGPLCWKAALYEAVAEPKRGHRHGQRLPTPAELLTDEQRWPAQTLTIPFKNGCTRALEVKVLAGVCGYTVAGPQAVQVVLVRDPKGEWRKEALVCTDVTLSAVEVITGYCRRWSVELDIRSLKVTLGMDQVRCQTPALIEREIWAHVLAYNLVRKVAAQAAVLAQVSPRVISFQATKQALLGSWQRQTERTGEEYVSAARKLLKLLTKERVGNRPDRVEPRCRKGRPKPHKLLTEPRWEAIARLLGKGSRKRRQ